jgi:putative addiction module killer protein
MVDLRYTERFKHWVNRLSDRQARARILVRLERMAMGNLGDVKPVGEGVSEARITHGPGYRLYFVRRGDTVIVLLCGGDKSSQTTDIKTALNLAREI